MLASNLLLSLWLSLLCIVMSCLEGEMPAICFMGMGKFDGVIDGWIDGLIECLIILEGGMPSMFVEALFFYS